MRPGVKIGALALALQTTRPAASLSAIPSWGQHPVGDRMRQVAMQVPTHVRTAWDAATYIARSAIRHRLNGHAAEISFFALLSLIPVTVTIGAALKLVSQTMGPDIADQGRQGAIDTIRLLIGPTLADSVVGPFVRAQLTQQDSSVAVGGLIVAWWLFGRLFTATQHGLDKAYGVSDRRSSVHNRIIALASSAAGLVAIVITLTLMVVGWRGDKHGIDKWLASVPIAADIWNIVRWPILVLILVALLVGLYRYSPNVRHRWRDCLPGAALGVLLWAGAAAIFRAYLMLGSGAPTGVRIQRRPGCADRTGGRRIDRDRGVHLLLEHRHPARGRGQRPHHPAPKAGGCGRDASHVVRAAAGGWSTPDSRTEGTGRDGPEGRTAAPGRRAGMATPRPRRCRHRPRSPAASAAPPAPSEVPAQLRPGTAVAPRLAGPATSADPQSTVGGTEPTRT